LAPQDTAQIVVAKEGVLEFVWGEPTKVVRTQNSNVELLKFEDTQGIFNSQIIMVNAESGTGDRLEVSGVHVIGRTITIEEARLGLMCVSTQGREEGEYLMIPVWDFYGYESFKLQDPAAAARKGFTVNENGEYVNNPSGLSFGGSFLTLNAADGSVISRGLGY
jgi:hypothetical protein